MTVTPRTPQNGYPGAVAVGVIVAVLSYAAAFVLSPSVRDRLITEDGIIETTTAVVFLAAAIAGAMAMLLRNRRRLLWVVPAFGLFGFLDEMSFGARIFGFPLPVVDGMEVDSFHDVFDLADRFAGDAGISRTMIAAFVATAVLAAGAWLLRTGRLGRIPAWLRRHRPIALVIASVGLLALGVALDILGTGDTARFAEETAEFAAAGLVAVAAADLFTPTALIPETAAADRGDAG